MKFLSSFFVGCAIAFAALGVGLLFTQDELSGPIECLLCMLVATGCVGVAVISAKK